MMALPEGASKGLAKVVAPLCFWMAAGWAAYPPVIEKITEAMNESVDIGEVRAFSIFMSAASIVAGVALAIHGFAGKEAADDDVKALGKEPPLCPYCGAALVRGQEKCPGCRRDIPEIL